MRFGCSDYGGSFRYASQQLTASLGVFVLVCVFRSFFVIVCSCGFSLGVIFVAVCNRLKLYESPGGNQVDGLPPVSSEDFSEPVNSFHF